MSYIMSNLFKKRNRFQNNKAKYGKFWCGKCDMELISDGIKCSNCGYVRNKHRKIRHFKNESQIEN